jgi:hypothetical protein
VHDDVRVGQQRFRESTQVVRQRRDCEGARLPQIDRGCLNSGLRAQKRREELGQDRVHGGRTDGRFERRNER